MKKIKTILCVGEFVIGTAVSFIFGSVIVMSIYYRKKLGIDMIKLYARIFKGLWLSIVVSSIACWVTTIFVRGDLLKLAVGAVVFGVVYAITLMTFGLNKKEKKIVIDVLKKLKR